MTIHKKHVIIGLLAAVGITSAFSLDVTRLGRVAIFGPATGKTGVCSLAFTPTLQIKIPVTENGSGTESIVASSDQTTYRYTPFPARKDTTVIFHAKGTKDTTLNTLFKKPSIVFFSDPECKNNIFKLIIPKGAASVPVYVNTAIPDGYTITASATNFTEGSTLYTTTGTIVGKIEDIINGNGSQSSGTFSILSPTAGAIDVTKVSATKISPAVANDGIDDTPAFNEAIRQASVLTTKQFAAGPTGAPQGVVYVPRGTYLVRNVQFKDNVRVEIDAGTVIKQALVVGNKNVPNVNLFVMSPTWTRTTVPAAPLSNVSLVGVGQSTMMGDVLKPATSNNWDISGSFTLNFDPQTTDASQLVKPILLMYTNGALIQNVIGIGNNSDPSNKSPLNSWYNYVPGVNSQSSVIWGNNQVNIPGTTAYYGPTNVTINNIYATKQTYGYGAIQLQSGRTIDVKNVFSEGGIALRLESGLPGAETLTNNSCVRRQQGGGGTGCTCSEQTPCALSYFSEINGLTADNISCLNGSTAVSLLPHEQANKNITITNVSANNCYAGIGTGSTGDPRIASKGSFTNVTITTVTVNGSNINGSGTHAQGDPADFGLFPTSWQQDATSAVGICVIDKTAVAPTIASCTKSGTFDSKKLGKCDSTYAAMCSVLSGLKSGAINTLR